MDKSFEKYDPDKLTEMLEDFQYLSALIVKTTEASLKFRLKTIQFLLNQSIVFIAVGISILFKTEVSLKLGSFILFLKVGIFCLGLSFLIFCLLMFSTFRDEFLLDECRDEGSIKLAELHNKMFPWKCLFKISTGIWLIGVLMGVCVTWKFITVY